MSMSERAKEQILADHGMALARIRTATRPRALGGYVMYDRGFWAGAQAAIQYMYEQLVDGWESMPAHEAVEELRKGDGSLFYPLFADDPAIWADCPTDGRVTVTVEGFCDSCGFPFDGAPRVREFEHE